VEPPGVQAIYGDPKLTVMTPYPSNRYAVADGKSPTGLRVSIVAGGSKDLIANPMLDATHAELNQHDGFSTSGGVIVSFTGPVDVSGIAPTASGGAKGAVMDASELAKPSSPLVLVDIDPKSPERGKARGLVARYWQQPADDYFLHDEHTIIAQPAEPLRPRTRYLFAVTDALRAADGGRVHRAPMMAELVEGRATGAYATELAEGLTVLESFGVARERVKLASVFTTMTVHDELLAAAKQVRATGAPKLLAPWTVETPAKAPDKRLRLRAVFEAPEYRSKATQRFEIGSDGAPKVQGHAGIEVFLAVSDSTSTARRPVVIFQHGLTGDKDGCWGTAERLAPLDAAVFAIDSPHHGARAEEQNAAATAVFKFFGIDVKDKSFIIGKARDNFRQMALDQLALIELIASLKDTDLLPLGAPDGKPDFDTSRVLYIGHSFGSVQGATIFALAPEITAAVWNVGGDVLTTLLRDSGTFGVLVKSMTPQGVSVGEVARFFSVIQAIVDPGDPINFARFGTLEPLPGIANWKARDVLVQEVIDDNIVPNSTSEALARAARLALLDPLRPVSGLAAAKGPLTGNLPSGATGAMSQFDLMDGKPANHGGLYFSTEGIAQYLGFFQSALKAPHATVPPSYPNGHP
jgi:hypothetical protein